MRHLRPASGVCPSSWSTFTGSGTPATFGRCVLDRHRRETSLSRTAPRKCQHRGASAGLQFVDAEHTGRKSLCTPGVPRPLRLSFATGELDDIVSESKKHLSKKRIGGLKGGRACAKSLSPQWRRKIAVKVARERWKSQKGD